MRKFHTIQHENDQPTMNSNKLHSPDKGKLKNLTKTAKNKTKLTNKQNKQNKPTGKHANNECPLKLGTGQ